MIRYLLFSITAVGMFAQTPSAPARKTTTRSTTTRSTTRSTTRAITKSTIPAAPPIPLPAEPGQYAILTTTQGRVVIRLYEKEAPITVANFAGLARGTKTFVDFKTGASLKKPFYNGLTFHRVIPKFMIQGGDPLGTGAGSGGVKSIVDEFDPSVKFDQPGKLAMANAGPNTGSCQFFITTTGSDASYLNGKHTIFGQVVEGQDVVDAISTVPTAANDKPVTPVVIKTLLIRRVGPDPNPPARSTAPATKKKTV